LQGFIAEQRKINPHAMIFTILGSIRLKSTYKKEIFNKRVIHLDDS